MCPHRAAACVVQTARRSGNAVCGITDPSVAQSVGGVTGRRPSAPAALRAAVRAAPSWALSAPAGGPVAGPAAPGASTRRGPACGVWGAPRAAPRRDGEVSVSQQCKFYNHAIQPNKPGTYGGNLSYGPCCTSAHAALEVILTLEHARVCRRVPLTKCSCLL